MVIYNLFIKSLIIKLVKFFLPHHLKKFIKKKIYPYYFYPTLYKKLPQYNYKNKNNLDHQIHLINKFNTTNKQNSFMTCSDLLNILEQQFNKNDYFNFLDYGGENIDFYLNLKKNFKNVNYFFFNLESINHIFKQVKKKFKYENIYIIDDINDLLNKQFDFINFGSSIQYVSDYINTLDVLSNNSKYIFFSGTTLFDSKDLKFQSHIVVKQTNCYPFNYLYFFNKNNFKNIFLDKKYHLVFERSNTSDQINYDNFKKNFLKIQYLDLLFMKKF